MNCGHTEDNRLENDGCATCHLHDGITWRDAEIQKLEARIERQRKANAAMHRQMDRKSALEVQVYKLEQAMVDIHASLLAGTAEACDEAERIAAKMTGAEFLTNVEEPAPRPSVSVPEVPYRPCTIHGGYDPSLKQCPGCLDAKLVDAPRPSDAQAREWCPKCKEPMANWGPDWPHKCPRTDAEKAMSLQFAADAAAMPRTKEAVASLEKATKAMLDNAGVTIEHGPRTNEAQSGPLCPGCGWPRTPQQSHAESCPVARGDGARCHRCGHYETSYERAASLYAHCPSCSRHTRWERVPNDPRTDSAKAWPEMPAWADDTDDDKPLPEDAEIKAAFPTRSERHDLYGEAMRLVGARRSKGGLVALVTWLLLRAEHQRTEPASPEPAWKRMGHDNSERCTTCGANWRNMPVTPCVSLSRQVKDDAASLNSDGAKERIPSQRPETPEVGAYARGVRDALETAALVVELEGAEGTKSLAKSLRAMVTGSEGT